MSPKIFITGITGFIGGSVASHIIRKHPEYACTALVRNEDQAAKVRAAYKDIRIVFGDLDSHEVLFNESAAADVVVHTASSDHPAGATSITTGILTAPGSKPGYLIHTSGTGILIDQSVTPGTYHPKVYDDVHDIAALTSLPAYRWHRDVDTIVLDSTSKPDAKRGIRTAIICPPTIYGVGSGPVKVRSDQTPKLVNAILKNGQAFTVNDGKNIWRNVDVADLADAFVLLVEEALKDGGAAGWDHDGYYFAENGEHSWGQLSRLIALYASSKGHIKTSDVIPLPVAEVQKFDKAGQIAWGSNSRGFASRFKTLGWKPFRPPIADWILEAVDFEIQNPEGASRKT